MKPIKMKKIVLIVAATLMAVMSAQAQKIQVVDTDGYGIPLVSVLNEEGNMIGTTDLNGVLDDVKGTKKVMVTHVAYKPQVVTVASLTDGRITMEDLNYTLQEIVVTPNPLLYVETYYRVYAFINDSLRFYQAGIMPNGYDMQKKKVEMGSHTNCCGDFCPAFGANVTWGARVMSLDAGKVHESSAKLMRNGGEGSKAYFTTLKDEGNGRLRIENPEGLLGYIVKEGNLTHTTIDAGKAQMYRNKRLGENVVLKKREEKDYAYQYTDVFKMDENGNSSIEDFVMDTNHWEWKGKKGRMKMVIETYATDRGYINKQDWNAKKKELKKAYKYPMTLDQLEAYATSHNIPTLAPTMRRAIEGLKKK